MNLVASYLLFYYLLTFSGGEETEENAESTDFGSENIAEGRSQKSWEQSYLTCHHFFAGNQ